YIDGKFNFHQRVYCIYNATMSTKLIYYYFGEFFANEAERHNAKSTVDSIRLPVLKNFPIVVPSPKEQKEIVDYLDRVTGQIDYSLDGFENQLKMLETYRREVIANTITK